MDGTASVRSQLPFARKSFIAKRMSALSKASNISVDARAGLDYIVTSNSSLASIFRHQSINYSWMRMRKDEQLNACEIRECEYHEYYRKLGNAKDTTLGEFIRERARLAEAHCQSTECKDLIAEHIEVFLHGNAKVTVSLQESSKMFADAGSCTDIITWGACRFCPASAAPIVLSRYAQKYSFGKFLEVLFYLHSVSAHPMRQGCPHCNASTPAVEQSRSTNRFFRCGPVIVKFQYDTVDLFEMRVPRFQIISNKVPGTANYDAAMLGPPDDLLFALPPSIDTLSATESARKIIDAARLDITKFYLSAKQIITSFEEYTEQRPQSEERMALLEQLGNVTEKFRLDEFSLYDDLKVLVNQDNEKLGLIPDNVSVSNMSIRTLYHKDKIHLNNIKRNLKKRVADSVDLLERWKAANAADIASDKTFILPDYTKDPDTHVFPGSWVVVRDDEPSSVIAFTLSLAQVKSRQGQLSMANKTVNCAASLAPS